MRHALRIALILAASLPLPVLAQSEPGLGLDLTEDPPATETARPAPPPLDVDTGNTSTRLSEVELAAEDRVKSVQRKQFLKRGRFELTPMAFLTLNDAFFPKFGPGLRAAFHLHDSLGVGVRFNQYNLIPSDNVRLAKRQLQSRLPSVHPKTSVALDLIWSPIYGKVAVFNSIRHFDLYVLGGAGAVFSQTSDTDGAHLATHLGIGNRFSLTDWMTADLSLIETLYTDRPGGGKSVVQHALSVNAGVSFFVPFSFEYKEP